MNVDDRWLNRFETNLKIYLKSDELAAVAYKEIEKELIEVRELSKGNVITLRMYRDYNEYVNNELYTNGIDFIQSYNVYSTGSLTSLDTHGKLTMYVGEYNKICMVTTKESNAIVCSIYVPSEIKNKSRFLK